MRASRERVEPGPESGFAARRLCGPVLDCPYHFHPEFEIVWIESSHGRFLAGDFLGAFEPGHLALLGPNLAHRYFHRPEDSLGEERAQAVVVQFLPDVLGRDLLDQPEMRPVDLLLERASAGLLFTGYGTRPLKLLRALVDARGPRRFALLLELLGSLATDSEVRTLASPTLPDPAGGKDRERLEPVLREIGERLTEPLKLANLARLAHLEPSAFSRYFHARMGLPVSRYILRGRLAETAYHLIRSDAPVGEIAFAAGFNSLTHFNRQFRKWKGMTPKAFREAARNSRGGAMAQADFRAGIGTGAFLSWVAQGLELPAGSALRRVDSHGRVLEYLEGSRPRGGHSSESLFARAVSEAFRWGEPSFTWLDPEWMAIALPLCANQRLEGGVIAEIALAEDDSSLPRALAERLEGRLAEGNRINLALMRERAAEAARERLRGEALYEHKGSGARALREVYWHLEPELFQALRANNRTEARRLLNVILLHIYAQGGEDLNLIRAFLFDLMATMSRTLSDCGADPAVALTGSFSALPELRRASSEEALSRWVSQTFERLIETAVSAPAGDARMRVQLILNHLRENCGEALSRDGVARRFGLSPAHFSRVLKEGTGQSFSTCLCRMRMERAVRLLRSTGTSILEVGLECGFEDPAYFARVFRRNFRMSPREFRNGIRKS